MHAEPAPLLPTSIPAHGGHLQTHRSRLARRCLPSPGRTHDLRRSQAVAIDLADLDLVSGELRVRLGKGRQPRQLTLPPWLSPLFSTGGRLGDWSWVRGSAVCLRIRA